MVLRLLIVTTIQIVVFAALLFAPAGTLGWWQAWVFVGLMILGTVVTLAALYPKHKAILEERMKPPLQKGQPPLDKALVVALLVTFFGAVVFIPVDIFHLHLLLGSPPPVLIWLGFALIIAGWYIGYRTLVVNAFAALVVKPQQERHQRVIDTDVYAIVRHPMYAGAALFCLGLPLWLGSLAGIIAALLPILFFAIRSIFEERFLLRELEGYESYRHRVRYRLIPGVW